MEEPAVFEKYPISTVAIYVVVTLVNYTAGLYLLYRINPFFSGLYLIFLLGLEIKMLKEGCICCQYYGKRCASGRGLVAALLFKKDNPEKFCERKVTWKNLLPHMLVSVVPVVAGIYLLVQGFGWTVLVLILVPIITWVFGNPLIYGKLACPHCKQGRICCPANEFFGKRVEKNIEK